MRKVAYDVVDYSIPPTGEMRPAQTLSRDWKPEMKPIRMAKMEPAPVEPPAIKQ